MIKVINYDNKRAEILVYGTIIDDTDANFVLDENGEVLGFEFPEKIRQQLAEIQNLPVLVRISSYGGDVSAAVSIFNMLQQHTAPVTVQIDSIAASSASLIAFAGQEIIMPENTFLMVHNPSGGGFGTSDYLLSIVDYLDKIRDMIASTYQKHIKNGVDIKKLMDAETWITAKEASEMFDNVKLVASTGIEAVAKFDVSKLSTYKNVPDAVKIALTTENNANVNNANVNNVNNNNVDNDNVNNNEANEADKIVDDAVNKILSVLRGAYDYEEKG